MDKLEEKQIARLKQLLTLLEPDQLTKEEFVKSFQSIMEVVVRIQKQTSEAVSKLEQTHTTMSEKMKGDHSLNVTDIKGMVKSEMAKMLKSHEAKMYVMDEKMDSMVDGINGQNGHTPTNDELRALIKPLIPKPVKGDKGDVGSSTTIFGGRTGGASKFHDLSSQANGTLKTFSVPKGVAGIVIGSDFPTILMENNGFTINANRTEIVLTVANAPSTGSQLLYQFVGMFN